MSLALITQANPRAINESHPSYLTTGKWKIVADGVKSKLSIRRSSPSHTMESIHAIGDIIDGECLIVIVVLDADVEDSRISVYAEKINV